MNIINYAGSEESFSAFILCSLSRSVARALSLFSPQPPHPLSLPLSLSALLGDFGEKKARFTNWCSDNMNEMRVLEEWSTQGSLRMCVGICLNVHI